MEISFRAKNMKMTDHLETYAREKLTKVDKYLTPLLEKQQKDEQKKEGNLKARVDLDIEFEKITKDQRKGDVYRVEAQMTLPGSSLRAEDTAGSPKEAISEVSYGLQRQVKKYKEKQDTLQKKSSREVKEKMHEEAGGEEEI